jgi:hypothetical protein
MSPDTYERLKTVYLQRLKDYFPGCAVNILIEAPEKADYGDIDFMIASDQPFDIMHLASAVGAAGFLSCGGLHMLAVPVDGNKHSRQPVRYMELKNTAERSEQLSEDTYAQIDIGLVKPELFAWHSFYSSYGDMSGLLGQIMHNLGFTVSDRGVTLRLQELDDAKESALQLRVNDKQGFLFLCNDPDQVMEFLGLSSGKYRAGFATMNDFYSWLAQCRLLTPDYVGNLQYKLKDTTSQRQKEHKRPMITNFFKEYIPAHLGEGAAGVDDTVTCKANLAQRRQQWCDEAVRFFRRGEAFEHMRRDIVESIANQTAELLIKPIVGAYHGGKREKVQEVVRAIRRWVVFEQGQAQIAAVSHRDEESQLRFWLEGDGLRDEGAVDYWIKTHWAQCRALERDRQKS